MIKKYFKKDKNITKKLNKLFENNDNKIADEIIYSQISFFNKNKKKW